MKFGILAPGAIASKMAQTVAQMPEIELWAVGSRSYEKAYGRAQTWGFARAYGSYREFLADPELELVYIASPHPLHYSQVKAALLAGKNVLVEKPFVVSVAQARELLDLSQNLGLLLAEAIWTRYMPSRQLIADILQSGKIGAVHSVLASLCYPLQHVARLSDPALAASALYEAGVYPINFACMFTPAQVVGVQAWGRLKERGSDISSTVVLEFSDGSEASLYSSLVAQSARNGSILGEDGYIEVQNINNPEKIRLYDRGCNLLESWDVPPQITGFEYQVQACVRAIECGLSEVEEMPHAEILRMMEILEVAGKKIGVRIPSV